MRWNSARAAAANPVHQEGLRTFDVFLKEKVSLTKQNKKKTNSTKSMINRSTL